jgi:ribose transport system substrate-binding protein
MSIPRLLVAALLFTLMLPLLNCGNGHDADEKYYLVADNIQVPYWQTAHAGFSQAAQELKVRSEFVGPDSFDPKAQQQAFEQVLQSGKPSGILISTADAKLMKDDINKAIAAGIPVLTIDSDAPESQRLFFIGTNNYEAGFNGGQRLAKELHGKGNVVVFTMPEQANLQERLRGYRDAVASTQIKFARVVDIKGDPRIAFDLATEIIGKEKDKVDAFVCLEAQAGKEIATVLNNNSVKNKVVIAMDTDPDTLEWIRRGQIAATISQKPYTMAYFGVMMLDHLYHHKLTNLQMDWAKDSFAPIPAFIDTGSSLIDKTNVDAFLQAKKSVTGGQK